jgi:hypothetical protein
MSTSLPRRAARMGVACLLGLATLEIALRVVAAAGGGQFGSMLRKGDPEDTLELRGAHCFRPWPGSTVRYPNGTSAHVNELGFRGPAVAIPKPAGTYRVLLLGGSTSHGFLVDDDQTIDAHLRRILRVPDATRVEVVNLGFDALDALCEQERLSSEGLALQPDAVILHTGLNDLPALRFAALGPDATDRGVRAQVRARQEARQRQRGGWRTVNHFWFSARLPGVLRNLDRPFVFLPGPPEPDPQALADLERTLHASIALVAPDRTVLLSMPPSLLGVPGVPLSCPYVADVATTRVYRERVDALLRRIAAEERVSGRDVRHVSHQLPAGVFLDDCHLDGEGNRLLAEDFARALDDRPAR